MVASTMNLGFNIGPAFSWASIGLAVVTATLQGLVAAMTFMTESSGQWTFRFRLAVLEHYWWTFVSVMLFSSLAMSITAFASGRGGDPVSVLALSSATFLAVIQYTLPAWQQRHYTRTRWYAWTGDSRTAIKKEYAASCLDAAHWARLASKSASALARIQATPSDFYGWRLWHVPGIWPDPTDVFMVMQAADGTPTELEKAPQMVGIFEPVEVSGPSVSFLWGRRQGFRPRVSRAVMSMPLSLLRSSPTTTNDGYNGKGLTLAMGILGRNKGLQPWKLVFKLNPFVAGSMEGSSTWTPRPAKVLRSFYKKTLSAQYQALGEDFVNAAVELALLLVDMPNHAIDRWLQMGLEHQSVEVNNLFAKVILVGLSREERNAVLSANYEASYTAMVISLNSMTSTVKAAGRKGAVQLRRPDVVCTGLLCLARGLDVSQWWSHPELQALIREEEGSLLPDQSWRLTAAMLLGLERWPEVLDSSPKVEKSERH